VKIQLKRSNVLVTGVAKEPNAEQMEYGELAVNYNSTDPVIFIKDSSDNVIRLTNINQEVEWDDIVDKPAIPGFGDIPDVYDGQININAAVDGGITVTGSNATANQSGNTTRTLSIDSTWLQNFAGGKYLSKVSNDHTAGSISIGNTVGDPNITLNSNGSITAAGDVKIGGTLPASPNIQLNADGSIEAAGDLTIGDKLIHNGDTNTAVRFPESDTVSVETAGSERLRIDSLGNVGIGATLPAAKLDIAGNVILSEPSPQIQFNNSGPLITNVGVANTLAFFTDSTTERLRIDSSGNVGIGGTLPAAPKIELASSGAITTAQDATINSVTVGRGGGDSATNTANGFGALQNNTTGTNNTANGCGALETNTTGTSNTANGRQALFSNTDGDQNTANGRQALFSNTTGNANTANGFQALYSNLTGNNNVANGYDALQNNTTGADNVAVGWRALYNNTTGSLNTANGRQALYSNLTGVRNAAFGHQAGYYIEGSNNTVLGAYEGTAADATLSNTVIISAGQTEKLRIDSTGSLLFGGTLPSAPNISLNASGSATFAGQVDALSLNSTSDITLKKDITPIENAVSKLSSINGVGFAWKKNDERTYGVIAQDVEKEFPELVNTKDFKSVNYNGLVGVLIEAVKELKVKMEDLNAEIEELRKR